MNVAKWVILLGLLLVLLTQAATRLCLWQCGMVQYVRIGGAIGSLLNTAYQHPDCSY